MRVLCGGCWPKGVVQDQAEAIILFWLKLPSATIFPAVEPGNAFIRLYFKVFLFFVKETSESEDKNRGLFSTLPPCQKRTKPPNKQTKIKHPQRNSIPVWWKPWTIGQSIRILLRRSSAYIGISHSRWAGRVMACACQDMSVIVKCFFWHMAKESVQMDYEEGNAEVLRKVDQNGENIKGCV